MKKIRETYKREELVVSCPICRNTLLSGESSDIEIICGKCRRKLRIEMINTQNRYVKITVIDKPKEQTVPGMIAI